jgi:uncharacterized protein
METVFPLLARELSAVVAGESKPLSSQAHLIRGGGRSNLFTTNGSRLIPLSQIQKARFEQLLKSGDESLISQELDLMGVSIPRLIDDNPLVNPPLHALSLAIAQKCNMGCSYCYAQQGQFGGPVKNMELEIAFQSINLLLKNCPENGKVQLSFLGGEPLTNRQGIRAATEYAFEKATAKNINIGFSITTNGTLLNQTDAEFFEKYGFAVTISLDGLKEMHDRQRPMKNGRGSFERILKNIEPLLTIQHTMQVSARVTVTSNNLDLSDALDEFIGMGFHSVGFSPLLKSGNGKDEMTQGDMQNMLEAMITCGLKFETSVLAGRRYPFLNMVNALKEISKGTHRPYPCGAGAGYMGVSADGSLAACHRFVNDPRGYMGDIQTGIDPALQNKWLADRHVHKQDPCTQCWARYLCGGGCHHEVLDKGRIACDYIRGWLYYTLQAHDRLSRMVPNWNQ